MSPFEYIIQEVLEQRAAVLVSQFYEENAKNKLQIIVRSPEYILKHCFWAAWSEGDVVGAMGMTIPGSGDCKGASLLVLPECRGLGIGAALLRCCIDMADSERRDFSFTTLIPDYFFKFGFKIVAPQMKNGLFLMRREYGTTDSSDH
jgi:N-acetylglutamate synthase-like GNAT family acetyltransferase